MLCRDGGKPRHDWQKSQPRCGYTIADHDLPDYVDCEWSAWGQSRIIRFVFFHRHNLKSACGSFVQEHVTIFPSMKAAHLSYVCKYQHGKGMIPMYMSSDCYDIV